MHLLVGYVLYAFFRLAAWVAQLLPLGWAYGLAALAGDLLFLVNKPVREAILDNVERVTGRRDTETARKIYRHLACNYVELFRVPRLSLRELESRLDIQGLEHFWEAYNRGKGVILASIHMGAPDVVAQWLAFQGIPVVVPVEPLRPRKLFEFFVSLRSSKGIRLIPADGPLKEIFKTLRRGGVVGLAVDRDVTESGEWVEFFGKPARLPDGAVQLAYRTGAPLVMAFAVRTPGHRFRVFVEPPLYIPRIRDRKEQVLKEGLARTVATIEKYIRAYPDQWLVSVRVWPKEATGIEAVKNRKGVG